MDPEQTQAAESSPATEATPAAAAEQPKQVEVKIPRDPAAYAEWRKSGKLPEAKPAKAEQKDQPKEASAPSKDNSETAPSAESGDKQEKPKPKPSNAETRLNEILADLKRAGFTPAELKTYKREAQQQAKADPQPAPEPVKGPEAPKRPKLEDFDSYEKYEEAREKYFEDLADFRAEKKLAEAEAKRAEAEAQRSTREKLDAATGRYGAEAAQTIVETAGTLFNDKQIPDAVKAIVNDSPVIADLMYVMGSKPDDLAEFVGLAKTNPGAAIRKAVLLENLIREELAKGGKSEATRTEDGKFASEKPPAKKTTQAPPPPSEVSGRNAAPADAMERAVAAKDFATFRRLANERELARRKGR